MSHPIVHIEFSANDHEEAGQFYSDVFGWETEEFPEMNYTTFAGPDGSVGGGFNPVSDDAPAGTVMVYIGTDDLASSLQRIEAHGGKIILPNYEIPGVGTMAVFSDPTGNKVALLQAIESPPG